MTAIDTKKLRELAEVSDDIWFEKEKLEHGEPYSDHVGCIASSEFIQLLDAYESQQEQIAVAKAALEVGESCPAICGACQLTLEAALKRMGEG